ncbi:MAG: hypothetical protein WC602_02965 [archaeon]
MVGIGKNKAFSTLNFGVKKVNANQKYGGRGLLQLAAHPESMRSSKKIPKMPEFRQTLIASLSRVFPNGISSEEFRKALSHKKHLAKENPIMKDAALNEKVIYNLWGYKSRK